jgi:hypothetical protein
LDFQDGLNPRRGFAGTRIFAHTRLFAGTRFLDRGSVFVYTAQIKPDPDEDYSTSCLFVKSRICFCIQNPYKTRSARTTVPAGSFNPRHVVGLYTCIGQRAPNKKLILLSCRGHRQKNLLKNPFKIAAPPPKTF